MGFELVKVVTSPTPGEHGGWSKHFFYDTGSNAAESAAESNAGGPDRAGDSGMIAFWEIHDSESASRTPPTSTPGPAFPGQENI